MPSIIDTALAKLADRIVRSYNGSDLKADTILEMRSSAWVRTSAS